MFLAEILVRQLPITSRMKLSPNFSGETPDYLVEHTKGDKDFDSLVAKAIESIPLDIHRVLAAAGHKIRTAGTVLDVPEFQHLSNTTPRGYDAGQTWKNSPGGYDYVSKIAVVAMSFFDSGSLRPNPSPEGTLREETGHAFDHAKGNFSANNRKFRKAYVAEASAVPTEARGDLAYFLQTDGGAE